MSTLPSVYYTCFQKIQTKLGLKLHITLAMASSISVCAFSLLLIFANCVKCAHIRQTNYEDEGVSNEISHGNDEMEMDQAPGEPLNAKDFFSANLINPMSALKELYQSYEDPILSSGLFEGDIQGVNVTNVEEISGRNAIVNKNSRWPDGTIPYVLSDTYNSYERSVIARAMSDYHRKTCIRFVARTTQSDYLYIYRGKGCSSDVGRVGGRQTLSLGNGCIFLGIAIHELMHATGFWHEQSRQDRDSYVTVMWSNILRGMDYNFIKYNWNSIQDLGESYDMGSVMHYEAYAFARDRSHPTLIPKDPNYPVAQMGQRHGFSDVDLRKVNKLYGCFASGEEDNRVPEDTLPTNDTETSTITIGNCKDFHPRCSSWANQGECIENAEWMKANCLLSCGICDKGCTDKNDRCKEWSDKGECKYNPEYMSIFCKKSCKKC